MMKRQFILLYSLNAGRVGLSCQGLMVVEHPVLTMPETTDLRVNRLSDGRSIGFSSPVANVGVC